MKYSQFIELNQILESQYLNIDNLVADPIDTENKLNEAIRLISLIAAGGLSVLFRKSLISYGLKQVYIKILNKNAEKLEYDIDNKLQRKLDEIKNFKSKINRDSNKLKSVANTTEGQNEIKKLQDENKQFETKMTNYISRGVDNLSRLKTYEVYEKIDSSKKIKKSHKLALKYYWETLIQDIKLNEITRLYKDKIFVDKTVLTNITNSVENIKKKSEEKFKKVGEQIKKEGDDIDSDNKILSKNDIIKNMSELKSEKNLLNQDQLENKIKLLVQDINKLKDEVSKRELDQILMKNFEEDIINKVKDTIKKESEEIYKKGEKVGSELNF